MGVHRTDKRCRASVRRCGRGAAHTRACVRARGAAAQQDARARAPATGSSRAQRPHARPSFVVRRIRLCSSARGSSGGRRACTAPQQQRHARSARRTAMPRHTQQPRAAPSVALTCAAQRKRSAPEQLHTAGAQRLPRTCMHAQPAAAATAATHAQTDASAVQKHLGTRAQHMACSARHARAPPRAATRSQQQQWRPSVSASVHSSAFRQQQKCVFLRVPHRASLAVAVRAALRVVPAQPRHMTHLQRKASMGTKKEPK
jgi:hypothetical protein